MAAAGWTDEGWDRFSESLSDKAAALWRDLVDLTDLDYGTAIERIEDVLFDVAFDAGDPE